MCPQIDTSYPRKIGNWWLGCPDRKVGQLGDGTLLAGSGQSAGQMDGRGPSVTNSGSHSVAGDSQDQFFNVDVSTTTTTTTTDATAAGWGSGSGSDTLGNGSVRVGGARGGLTSLLLLLLLISAVLQHLPRR